MARAHQTSHTRIAPGVMLHLYSNGRRIVVFDGHPDKAMKQAAHADPRSRPTADIHLTGGTLKWAIRRKSDGRVFDWHQSKPIDMRTGYLTDVRTKEARRKAANSSRRAAIYNDTRYGQRVLDTPAGTAARHVERQRGRERRAEAAGARTSTFQGIRQAVRATIIGKGGRHSTGR